MGHIQAADRRAGKQMACREGMNEGECLCQGRPKAG